MGNLVVKFDLIKGPKNVLEGLEISIKRKG